VYLGADQDAWAASQRIGAHSANAASFGKRDMRAAFRMTSDPTSAYRSKKEPRSRDFWESGRPPSEPGTSGKAAQASGLEQRGHRPGGGL
jgi:hypothetical protein